MYSGVSTKGKLFFFKHGYQGTLCEKDYLFRGDFMKKKNEKKNGKVFVIFSGIFYNSFNCVTIIIY